MSTRHILLGLLSSGPSHGYDLKRRHDERFPQARPLAYGQVYTTLQRLVRDGLAKVEGTDSDGGPERTVYRATDDGERELARWTAQTAPPAPFVANEIFAKVVVAILAGGDPVAYLRDQRAAHMARMRQLTKVKTTPGADLATVLSADYALSHLDADLRWMSTTADRLATLTAEVTAR
ncbi:PadR family transcriptional regulator [Streptomyces fragilis]|uniref:PadR family transcriptional regulator n=1 Tax=Streptomyces fragilis TaxID=67301 RepID=A0ABV2YGX8_9ACTN|nr:PadR family transcriptional regulator [Streptomyces fragilis]